MRHIYMLTAALAIFCGKGYSQVDPHFSQYYAYPIYLNPALTGAIDGDYRITAIYRDQWSGIDNGFKTPGISADFRTNNNFNIGVNLMNQSAGGGVFNSLNAYASLAYTGVRFGTNGNHHLTMGISLGAINRRFDQTKFRTGSQWDAATGYDPTLPNRENLTKPSATVFDAGAGLLYFDATPQKKSHIFAGFSAYHLTRPSDPFIAGGTNERLPMRLSAHGGIKIGLSDVLSITPNVLYMRQGNADEKMVGAYGQLMVNETLDFLVGANYRYKDAVSPYVGFYYKDLVIGLNYDVNVSDLGKAGGGANSFEVSLSFTGRKRSKGETVPFICPRL